MSIHVSRQLIHSLETLVALGTFVRLLVGVFKLVKSQTNLHHEEATTLGVLLYAVVRFLVFTQVSGGPATVCAGVALVRLLSAVNPAVRAHVRRSRARRTRTASLQCALVREFLDPTPGRNCTRNGRICGIYRRRASSGER